MAAAENPPLHRRCDCCYFAARVPRGTVPLMCERERPTVPVRIARAPGGVCEDGRNWLLNHRAPVDQAAADGAID